MLFDLGGLIEVLLILLALVVAKVYVKLTAGRCRSNVCLIGKTAIVTGGNSGMGYQTALALAGRGARVIIADKDDSEQSKEKIIRYTYNKDIVTKYVDFTNLETVRAFANDIIKTEGRLDILVNNAGVGSLGNAYTKDNLHVGMQINHFAPFLLTNMLTGLLKKSAPSRIVFVTSELAFYHNLTVDNLNYPPEKETHFGRLHTYANSKLCNIITSDEFSRRLADAGVISNAVHPGLVNTPIFAKSEGFQYITSALLHCYLKFISKSAEEGAQSAIYAAVSNTVQNISGKYLKDCKVDSKPKLALNLSFAKDIWNASEKFVNLAPEEKHL